MVNNYVKPEVEFVDFRLNEAITDIAARDIPGGDLGVMSGDIVQD